MDVDVDVTKLAELPRRELQALAKARGIKANGKTAVLIESLRTWFLEHAETSAEVSSEAETDEARAGDPLTAASPTALNAVDAASKVLSNTPSINEASDAVTSLESSLGQHHDAQAKGGGNHEA